MVLIQALSVQHQIGWDRFFCGRISGKWARLYKYDVQLMQQPEGKNTSEYWSKTIVSLTYKIVLEAWKN
jgi:hypothetical protein